MQNRNNEIDGYVLRNAINFKWPSARDEVDLLTSILAVFPTFEIELILHHYEINDRFPLTITFIELLNSVGTSVSNRTVLYESNHRLKYCLLAATVKLGTYIYPNEIQLQIDIHVKNVDRCSIYYEIICAPNADRWFCMTDKSLHSIPSDADNPDSLGLSYATNFGYKEYSQNTKGWIIPRD